MRYCRITILITLLMCCAANKSVAQEVVVRVPELADNKEYMQLLQQDVRLTYRADSLMNVMSGLRQDMRVLADKRDADSRESIGKLSEQLSEVEATMIALRQDKIKLVDKINSIEQEFVLSSVLTEASLPAQSTGSIFNNAYFRENILAEDYDLLMKAHKQEAEAKSFVVQYVANYNEIKALYDEYVKASLESDAERLYASISEKIDENMVIEKRLARVWTEIFDQKTYVYSYFLEKEGRYDVLDLTENMTSEARQQQAMLAENCVSEVLADYCLQKPVVINYEMCVARLLNLPHSIDSLASEARAVRQVEYRLPLLDIDRRSFVDYAPIEFRARTPYNSSNPVPECVVYEYGTIYRILLGTYKLPQATTIFRGAVPLYVEEGEDGRYSYYAGGLRTRSEAEAAVEIMKKKGFRNPRIVEWCDGRKTNLSEEGLVGDVSYRVVIKGGQLDDMIQDIIATMAAGCQVSKLTENTFVVGMFDSKAVAQRLANALMKCDESLDIKVVELKGE
ncbi:MAG: hypothetical protein E7131_02915 [Rikenellaceae bacterium]|nr:hypothetical protein [Rikenellaceae bacterium]